jgi:GNAT superfamily N-acetyltransferase
VEGGLEVRLFRPDDDRAGFDSGNLELDRFFRHYAGQTQFRHHIGASYVAVEGGEVLGFVTLAVGHLEIEGLPKARRKRLPGYPLPILRLSRLAVGRSAQGRGVGKLLLRAVCRIAEELAQTVGCIGIVVDAKPDAVSFYQRYGFEPIDVVEGKLASRPSPQPMFLPLA